MTYTEILDLIQRLTGTQNTTTSSYTIAQKTVDVNNALSHYFILANEATGNWRPADDTNQEDYPIIYRDLVSGRQDYHFTVDEKGNQILGIYKVRSKDSNGNLHILKQIDQESITDTQLDTTSSGTPSEFYLTANGIFLVQKPSYNSTAGLEIWIDRTPTYFSSTDTTKKAGIPWAHHEYLALRPAYFYCVSKGLPQAVDYRLRLYGNDGRGGMEDMIKKYYSNRNRSLRKRLVSNIENTR